MHSQIRPLYRANRLFVQKHERSIEGHLGTQIYNTPLIRDEKSSDGTFKAFSTLHDMWNYIESFPKEMRHFHEVIFGQNCQRLRFDIDAAEHPNKTDNLKLVVDEYELPLQYQTIEKKYNAVIQYLIDIIFEVFMEHYSSDIKKHYPGYTISKDKIILVTESHSKTKYSFHIVITKFVVKNAYEAKWFMEKVVRRMKEVCPLLVSIVDRSIYAATQFFRILGCCKSTDPFRSKEISLDNMNYESNIDKGLIQNYNFDNLLIYITHYDIGSGRLPKGLLVDKKVILSPEVIEKCKQVIEENIGDGYTFAYEKGNLFEYRNNKNGATCKICNRAHNQENAYAYLSGNLLYWNCRRNHRKDNHLQLGMIDNDTTFDRFTYMQNIKDEIQNVADEELDPFRSYKNDPEVTFREYNKKQLEDFPMDYSTLYVKAPMKMGKSKQLIKHLRSLKEEINSILVVSFRRAFTEEFLSKFNTNDGRTGLNKVYGGDLEDYKNISLHGNRKIIASMHPFVMVQVESFHRVNSTYDCVILDESESIYDQFSSSNIKSLSLIINNFHKVIANAKRVICMDAYMSERTVELTNKLRKKGGTHNDNIKFVMNTFKNQGPKSENGQYKYNIGYCENAFFHKLDKVLSQGKRVVILSNTRDKLKAYEKLITKKYKDLNIQSYTSLSKYKEKCDLKDVNRTWLQYQVVMYSPTITAGISFEEKHFDQVFCLFSNMSCNVLACMQMMGRIRDVKDKEITILLEEHYTRCSVSKEGIEEDLIDSRLELLSIPFVGSAVYDDMDLDNFKYKPFKDSYYYIWLQNQLSYNISKKTFLKYLMYCIHITGAEIVLYDKEDGTGKIERKSAQQDVRTERYEEIAKTPLPTPEEYDRLVDKSQVESLTVEEGYAIQKHWLRRDYHINNDHILYDVEFIETYFPTNIRYIYNNLEELLTNFSSMEDAIQDIGTHECMKIRMFIREEDSQSDLNLPIKATLHRGCYLLLLNCGFDHILDKKLILKGELGKRLTTSDCLSLIQINLKRHTLRPARLSNSKKVKELPIKEQYFLMALEGINRIFVKFYGIQIEDNGEDKYYISLKHNFFIVESETDQRILEDTKDAKQPVIWCASHPKPRGFKIKHPYKDESLIGISSNNDLFDFNFNLTIDKKGSDVSIDEYEEEEELTIGQIS